MSSRQIATSTLWQFASQIAMAALSIITVKFVAIGLSKELAGHYNSAYGFLQLFGILADFGLYAVAVREVAKARGEKRNQVFGALIILRTCILFLSLGSAIALVWLLPMWKGTSLPTAVLIASLVPLFTLLAGIIRTVFQVHYRLEYVFIAEVLQRVVTAGLIGALVIFGVRGSTDVSVLYAMLGIGGLGALVLLGISLVCGARFMPIRPYWDRTLLLSLVKKAAPFGIAYLCTALYRQFDVTLIALLREDFALQNAYYGFVMRMSDMGFLLPTFLLNSTLPILSERDSKGEDTRALLGNTVFLIAIIGSISFLFAALWSRPLILLLTTEQYLSTAFAPGSDTALRMISWSLLCNGIILYSFYVLLNRHAWRPLVLTLSGAAVVSILLNVLLISQYGFVGAAATSVIIHVLLVLALLPQALFEMPVHITRTQVLQWLCFSSGLFFMLILFAPLLKNELLTCIGLVATTVGMAALAWGLKMHRLWTH